MKKLLLALWMTATPLYHHAHEWRGVMIDVSRHFASTQFLRRQVEAMSHFGLNRLHLHLTDAAGWRLEIRTYPRLTQLAAWRTAPTWKEWWNDGKRHYAEEGSIEAHGGYYTQDEMRKLVHYADSLGVQIVPEIEFPAHSEEVTAAYPELGCTGQPYQCADFCLGSEATYTFMNNVLEEIKGIFSSPYIHIGGDEAGGSRWMDCPRCQQKMQQLGLTTPQQLQQYAMDCVAGMVREKGSIPVVWDEYVTLGQTTSNKELVVMVWRDVKTAEQAISRGYDVVMCPGRWYYLDAYQDAPLGEPEAMGGYTPLRTVWEGPELGILENRLLGRQVNLWTEYVTDERHAERMLWPRALAISAEAEKIKNKSNEAEKIKSKSNGVERIKERKREAIQKYGLFRRWVIKEALPWLRSHDIRPFPLEQEVGQRKEYMKPVKSLATGKKVRYNSPYYEGYAAGGDGALTDGLRGGWTNTDGRWQGFIKRGRMDAVIDLEKKQQIHSIEAGFMQSLGPEIFLPERLIISVSDDGEHFTPLYQNDYPRHEQAMDYCTWGWKGKTQSRFVRFQALAGDRGGWVFSDEIIIK